MESSAAFPIHVMSGVPRFESGQAIARYGASMLTYAWGCEGAKHKFVSGETEMLRYLFLVTEKDKLSDGARVVF